MTLGRIAFPALLALAFVGCTSTPSTGKVPEPPRNQEAWVITEGWDAFAQNSLWPQEWALGHWHRYRVTPSGLDLTPVVPIPAPPAVRVQNHGGDPRIWRLQWSGSGPGVSGREVSFWPAEAQGLPPSLWALRHHLITGSGLVRVVHRAYEGGRITIVLEVTRGVGD